MQVLKVSFENSNYLYAINNFIYYKQLAYSIHLVLTSLQILPFHFMLHCCYGRYYIKYIYTHGRCLRCIPQVQDLQRKVKMHNNIKLSLGNRFHSSLFTLEVHLISFQKILKLFSSLTVPGHFDLFSGPLNSGMAKRPFYITS